MRKTVSIILFAVVISGCVNRPVLEDQIDREYGWVKIYSTNDMQNAQTKANQMCGQRAFYLKQVYESDLKARNSHSALIPSNIPFQCDVYAAAKAGNLEAQQHQYEVHSEYAKKHGGDSFSTVNPDGSIEAHSFDGTGNACHGSLSKYGSETYCD